MMQPVASRNRYSRPDRGIILFLRAPNPHGALSTNAVTSADTPSPRRPVHFHSASRYVDGSFRGSRKPLPNRAKFGRIWTAPEARETLAPGSFPSGSRVAQKLPARLRRATFVLREPMCVWQARPSRVSQLQYTSVYCNRTTDWLHLSRPVFPPDPRQQS